MNEMNIHKKDFVQGWLFGIWLKYMLIGSVGTTQRLMTNSKLNSYSNIPNIIHYFMQGTTYHKLDLWINCKLNQIYCYRAKLFYKNGPFSLSLLFFFCTCLAEQVITSALYSSTTSALESMQLRDILRSLHLTTLVCIMIVKMLLAQWSWPGSPLPFWQELSQKNLRTAERNHMVEMRAGPQCCPYLYCPRRVNWWPQRPAFASGTRLSCAGASASTLLGPKMKPPRSCPEPPVEPHTHLGLRLWCAKTLRRS